MERVARSTLADRLTPWAAQAAGALLSFSAAFALKLGTDPADWSPWFGRGLAVALAVKFVVFALMGVAAGMPRYVGVRDLLAVARAAFVSGVALVVLAAVLPAPEWLVPVALIDAALHALALVSILVAPRAVREILRPAGARRRALVVGAGDAGEAIVRELRRSAASPFEPVVLLDDDPAKRGRYVHGVRVEGAIAELAEVARRWSVEAVIIAIGGLDQGRLREIRALAAGAGLPVKRIPVLASLLSGRAGISDLQDFDLEDLLVRDPVRTDAAAVGRLLGGRKVLLTGAAGSIGSELCRQILRHRPSLLLLLDVNENALFELDAELRREVPGADARQVLCNARDEVRLRAVFEEHRPAVVFHAAAYKHVPVLEHFPEEAVRSNVEGTRNVARLADEFGAERFVFISTDKAVRPTSVMGATKRVAELIVGDLDARSATRFSTIRFGNVLGSNGSVMRIFREQVARGGPVTVTHPEMRRYFMSIPEAVELVLFAAAMDERGSTYVLDMGEQVRILDLAEHYVRLCGLEPHRDVEIRFVGLRPGEKLYEELWTEAEAPEGTEHPSILRAPRTGAEPTDLSRRVEVLVDWAREGDRAQVLGHLESLVEGYVVDPGTRRAAEREAERRETGDEKSARVRELLAAASVGPARDHAGSPVSRRG